MLTGINTVNSNHEIVESYMYGYRNGCEHSKVKLIEAACKWLENNIENYISQADYYARIDSKSKEAFSIILNSKLKEDFKNYLKGVFVN